MVTALLLAALLTSPAPCARSGQRAYVSTDPIVARLPGYPWCDLRESFHLYATDGTSLLGGGGSERDRDTWTGRVSWGDQRWLVFTNRSCSVSLECLVRVCSALAHVEDLGLDLTNRNATDAELAALARAHPRLHGLMLREAVFGPWESSLESLVPFARSLRSLELDVHSLDDGALAVMLAPLERLERVRVGGASGAETLEVLADLEHLRSLRLESSHARPADLARLLARGRVEELVLSRNPRGWPPSGWLEVLAAADSLKGLGIDASDLTEPVVQRILALPALEWIELHGRLREGTLSQLLSRPWKGLRLPTLAHLDTELIARLAGMPALEWLDLGQVRRVDLDLLAPLGAVRTLRHLYGIHAPGDDPAPLRRLLETRPRMR